MLVLTFIVEYFSDSAWYY